MRLYLIRHATTDHNAQRRYTGQSDVPLSDDGRREAQRLAQRLARTPFTAIVSSDLIRARDTAAYLAQGRDLAVQIDPDLRETNLGAWEGKTHEEARLLDPERMALWERDPARHAPPGGETIIDLATRMRRALDRWLVPDRQARVAWVSHGGSILVLLCALLGLDLRQRWQLRCDNASISEVEIGDWSDPAERYAILMRLNDRAHLEI
jgi:alpha-ribazole phosphatase